jgi:ATP-binding cassette subfamily B protein
MSLGRIMTVYQMGMVSIESIQTVLNSSVPDKDQINLEVFKKKKLRNKGLRVVNLSYSYPKIDDEKNTKSDNKGISSPDI